MKDQLSTQVGEIGSLINNYDWSQSPLGAIENWSEDLKTAVEIFAAELDRAKAPLNQSINRLAHSIPNPILNPILNPIPNPILNPIPNPILNPIPNPILNPLVNKYDLRYRALFNSIDQGFSVCELHFNDRGQPSDYRFIEVNNAFEAISGLKSVEGKLVSEVIPNLENFWFETYAKVVLTGESVRVEHQVSGLYRWFEVNAFPIEAPQKYRFGILFTDISDRKHLEEDLYSSRERLNLVIDSADLGLWYCDLPFDQLEWNDTVKAHFGLSPDTQVTMDLFYERIHFSDRDRVEAKITESIQNHQSYDIDYRTVAANGKVQWIRSLGRAFYDATGKPVRFDGVTINMTKQKEIEQELYRSEARYRHLAESIPQLVWIANMQGGNEYVNQQMCEYTGLEPSQLMGLDWKVIIHPDDWAHTNERWANAIQQSSLYEIEYRLRSADGNYRWHLGRAIPVKDEEGNTVGIFGTATDVEEQKQLVQKLALTIEQVQERNQELDQFAHIVSHDLKAPLRAIANLAEWIEEDLSDLLPEDSKAQMQLLRGRVYRMDNLLNGILEFAKVGRTEMKVETVSIPALLAEIVDTLLPPSSFTVQIDPDLPTIQTQSILLRQVFTNLIDNAIKHHPDRGGWVRVSSQDLGDYYEFAIADNGKGIEPESQEKIFTIFQTLESRDNRESTGVGLAIVKKIVTTEGGKIYLKSVPDLGSTFYFTWLKAASPQKI
jgi:PAS domain S-box-containing protein